MSLPRGYGGRMEVRHATVEVRDLVIHIDEDMLVELDRALIGQVEQFFSPRGLSSSSGGSAVDGKDGSLILDHMGLAMGYIPGLFHVHNLRANPLRVMLKFSPCVHTNGLHSLDLLRSQMRDANFSDVMLRVPEFRMIDQEESYLTLVRAVLKHYTDRLISQFFSAVGFDAKQLSGISLTTWPSLTCTGRREMGSSNIISGGFSMSGMPPKSRAPRLFGLDDSLQIFMDYGPNFDGPGLLGSVKGRYFSSDGEKYVLHFQSADNVCIVTNKTLLVASHPGNQLEWEVPLDEIDVVNIHFGRALQVLDREAARAYALGHRVFDLSSLEDSKSVGSFKNIFICENLDVLQALKSMLDWYVVARTTLS